LPGNVRQLQNTMHQVVVLNDAETVEYAMLPEPVTSGALESGGQASASRAPALGLVDKASGQSHLERRQQIEPLWLTEKNAIEAAVATCDGNINQAAGLLEVAPSTLYRKLQSWKSQQA